MKIIITILAIIITVAGFTQKTITGRVIDEQGTPLSYSTVTLLSPADSTLIFFGVTNSAGQYQIKNIKNGEYIMQFSFVGMKTIYEKITVASGKSGDFGDKVMKKETLKEAEVIAEYIPIKFRSDTVEYNAKAFDVKPDAVAEDLLKKIPGVEVDESGNIKAQGEDVTKVLVDGKEFFGKDTKVATKNLPAKAVEKVQVYDKKSEEAEFMGIDDGVRDRTINLVLGEKHKKGYFGNIEAGFGTDVDEGFGNDNYYQTETKLYRFSEKMQIAALGMYNNLNKFGYSSKGHGDWGRTVDGLNTTLAGGFNASYSATQQKRYFMSYLASSTEKILEQISSKESFLREESYLQDEELDEEENDIPHVVDFGIRHQFGENGKLTIDGDVDISTNDVVSLVSTETRISDTLINYLDNLSDNNSELTSASAKAVYIQKFNDKKTQLKANANIYYDRSISKINWETITTLFNPSSTGYVDQYQNNNTEKLNFSISPSFVQQIMPLWHLTTEVNIGSDNEALDRSYSLFDVEIDSLGSDFSTERTFVQPKLYLRRGTAQSQFMISIGAGFDQFTKINNGLLDGTISNIKEDYTYILPGFSYENNYRTGRRIKLRYSSGISMPSVNQLLPVINNTNPVSLYQGNIDLTPEYSHNLSAMWGIFDQFSFTSMFVRIGASHTKDKISFSQTLSEDYIQTITPVNVDYENSLFGFLYFSTPYRPLGIKLNIRASENISNGQSFINNIENVNTSFTHSLRLSVENRSKKKWDIMAGGSLSLTDSKFSIAEDMNNIYYNTKYFSEIRFTPNDHWSFEVDGSLVNYSSKSFNDDLSIPLIEAEISYFFLKAEKASFSLRGYDLLDKSENIMQSSNTNYILTQQSNAIGRYVMLIFRYRIGNR